MDEELEECEPGVPYEESSVEDYEDDPMSFTVVDIRCPVGPQELLMRYRMVDAVVHIDKWNLMELMCSFCTRMGRKQDSTVKRVIHKYNLLAELVESSIERVE